MLIKRHGRRIRKGLETEAWTQESEKAMKQSIVHVRQDDDSPEQSQP